MNASIGVTELGVFFNDGYGSLGKDATQDDVPSPPEVPQVAPSNALGSFQDYAIVAVQLKQAYSNVHDTIDAMVKKSVKDSAKWSDTGQRKINLVVDEKVVAMAPIPPADGIKIDDHHWIWITDACNTASTELENISKEQGGVAKDIDDQTARIKELEETIKRLEAAQKDPALDPPAVDPNQWPPGVPNPPATDNTLPPGLDGLDGLDDPNNSDLTPPGLNDLPGTDTPGLNGQTPGGLDGIGNTPGTTTPSVPATPISSPMGSGMDMMSSMLPMMMQQAMMRNMADRDLNSRREELDPRRFEDDLDPVSPPPVTAPVTAQPATVQTATTAPATQHSGAPTGTPSSTQPTVAPGRTPGADGSVIYTFPDGRTQKVSAMVAQALDGAFGNASGTDAQKAYEKTPAKWSDKKQIGDRVDPYQLMTGDVATWDKRTAILVVFGSEEGGTLEAVVNGELKPFTPEMTDSAGEFGQFAGFVHPKGIELTAPAEGGAPPATPGSADQSANAAMPVVAAG
ncbi:hypothetical protein IU470_03235 [Nocardia abscessus]|uniref:Uncharacterized protein n=1 Tax=Nocardia abscessus TaxID=120957 RepID=A0ABS0C183_9NOCA|nr:hypothetical protein [Nocardia abscessus]MBF6224137.1 hypothetical protein [Nocardia abscessus]